MKSSRLCSTDIKIENNPFIDEYDTDQGRICFTTSEVYEFGGSRILTIIIGNKDFLDNYLYRSYIIYKPEHLAYYTLDYENEKYKNINDKVNDKDRMAYKDANPSIISNELLPLSDYPQQNKEIFMYDANEGFYYKTTRNLPSNIVFDNFPLSSSYLKTICEVPRLNVKCYVAVDNYFKIPKECRSYATKIVLLPDMTNEELTQIWIDFKFSGIYLLEEFIDIYKYNDFLYIIDFRKRPLKYIENPSINPIVTPMCRYIEYIKTFNFDKSLIEDYELDIGILVTE